MKAWQLGGLVLSIAPSQAPLQHNLFTPSCCVKMPRDTLHVFPFLLFFALLLSHCISHTHTHTLSVCVSSPLSLFLCTGSHDRSIRRWERTSEPFFVEEEKERRLESLFEADLEQQQQCAQKEAGGLVLGPEGASYGGAAAERQGEEGAVTAAGRRTIESVSAADAIIDALDVAAHEAEKMAEYEKELRAAKVGELMLSCVSTLVW